jgi:mannose-1-phosphate guanylyltransferase/phosphomannomutase
MGAVIDAGGERLTLIDGTGRILSDDEALMAYVDLVSAEAGQGDGGGAGAGAGVRVALPVTASDKTLQLCESRGVEVVSTALSSSNLMEAAAAGGVTFAGDQEGGFIFPSFLPSFDGAAALVELIALLRRADLALAEVAARLPAMAIFRSEVETPFAQKGLVMRTLMEQVTEDDADVVLIDGVKVRTDDGWVLVVPDPEEPTTHVWAEGVDRAHSEELTERYVDRLRQLLS